MEGSGAARREPEEGQQQPAGAGSTTQQGGGGGGGVITRRTPMPTCHHPLAAEMGPGSPAAVMAMGEPSDRAAPVPAGAAAGAPEEGPEVEDVCAACRFGITDDEPAVRALQGLYHRECFRCHDCGAALLPPGPSGPADAVARALRRLRLGSLDEADPEEGAAVEQQQQQQEGGSHLTFLQLGGLPLCREHFRARLQQEQQEQDNTAAPASPPTSAFATPDRPAPQHQHQQQPKPPPPASPAGSQEDGGYATASAPSSPQVRFALPPAEPQRARLPPIFHSADGLSRLEIPPPDDVDADRDGIGRGSSEPSPTSLARLRRSKSATTLRSGARRPHQRRGSHAHPLLSVAARETEAERDARLLRRRASQQELLFGTARALSPPLGGEGHLTSPQRQPQLPPPRPLTTASALAYGVQVMGATGAEAAEEEAVELDKAAFCERRQRELVYSGGDGDGSNKPVSFFWEEAAPAVFVRIRALFGVAPGAYAAALATLEEEEDGRESGTGKSGSRFLRPPRTESGAPVIVKSVSDEEEAFLLSILEDYYQVVLHRPTLLPRFLGIYRIKEPGKPPTRLLAQRNVFAVPTPHLRLRELFDLKGSLIRRLAVAPPATENGGGSSNSSSSSGGGRSGTPPLGAAARANGSHGSRARVPVQKDLAFCRNHDGTDDAGNGVKAAPGAACRVVRLGPERKKELLSFLAADVEWLRRRNVVDYSLLLGCANLQELNTNPWARRGGGGGGASSLAALLPGAPDEESRHRLYSLWLPEYDPTASTTPPGGPGGAASPPSTLFRTQHAYVLGVVDVLQTFTFKRRLETVVKSGLATFEGTDPGGLSIVDPATYAQRFISWVDAHFS